MSTHIQGAAGIQASQARAGRSVRVIPFLAGRSAQGHYISVWAQRQPRPSILAVGARRRVAGGGAAAASQLITIQTDKTAAAASSTRRPARLSASPARPDSLSLSSLGT